MATATRTPAAIRRELPRLTTPDLPNEIDSAPASISKPAKEYTAMRARAAAAIERVVTLEAARADATSADREAYATALRVGKPDPGARAGDALEAEIETASREVVGLIDATRAVWPEFTAALAEHALTWREKLQAEQAKAVGAGAKALDAAEQAVAEVARVRGTLRWLSDARLAVDGDRIHGVVPRRFPRGGQGSSTTINVGQVSHEADWILAVVRGWLDGGGDE